MGESRRLELSILNVYFCLLVVLAHTLSAAFAMLDKLSWQFGLITVVQRLCTVAVPGFFFLSGVKLTLPRPRQRTLGEYYLGRARNILLPYLLAAAAHYLYALRGGAFVLADFLRGAATGTLSAQFYFVVALVQFILLGPAFRELARRASPAFAIPAAAVLTLLCYEYLENMLRLFAPGVSFPYANRVFLSWLVYYLAGCFAGENYERFLFLLDRERGRLTVCALLFSAADAVLTVLDASGRQSFPGLWLVHPLAFSCAIPALYSWAAQAKPLGQGRWVGLFRRIDRASYLIYLYHSLIITMFNIAAPRLGITRIGTQLVLRAVIVYTVTIGGCILWQMLWGALRKKLGPAPPAEKA